MKKTNLALLVIGGFVLMAALIYYLARPQPAAQVAFVGQHAVRLLPEQALVVAQGAVVYAQHCAACHGADLRGQPNWRARSADGRLPAPPHDESGHTWHHSDSNLFNLTKYGIEAMLGKQYPNNMPAYANRLTDADIIAALSFIKSQWPDHIKRQHAQINAAEK